MSEWVFKNRFIAGFLDCMPGDGTVWLFRFVKKETGQKVLVMARNEEEAWERLAEGRYAEED